MALEHKITASDCPCWRRSGDLCRSNLRQPPLTENLLVWISTPHVGSIAGCAIFDRMSIMSSSVRLRGLIGWLALAFVAAALGGLGSVNAPDFYSQLVLPEWAPPAWLFGPVWTLLYLMMGLASWLVWRVASFDAARLALLLYLVQLALNTLWSWLFFAWQNGLLAFIEIIFLWLLILATLMTFSRISKTAALLLVPYLFWVTFAAALAWNCWQLNPELLG